MRYRSIVLVLAERIAPGILHFILLDGSRENVDGTVLPPLDAPFRKESTIIHVLAHGINDVTTLSVQLVDAPADEIPSSAAVGCRVYSGFQIVQEGRPIASVPSLKQGQLSQWKKRT